MRLLKKAVILAPLAFAAGCTAPDPTAQKISAAEQLLRRQVASDIEVTIDPSSIKLNDSVEKFYYVCGVSILNRPGSGPLALNNVEQRFITTVNRAGAGGRTLFDGSSSPEGKEEFQASWDAKCPQ